MSGIGPESRKEEHHHVSTIRNRLTALFGISEFTWEAIAEDVRSELI